MCIFLGYYASYSIKQTSFIETPNLIGKSLPEALINASAQQLSMGVLAEKEDAVHAEGTVLNQIPQAGQRVRPHHTILVTIAHKPQPYLMPNLLNLKEAEITEYATKQKKSVKTILLTSSRPEGSCFAQVPAPEKQITRRKITAYLSAGTQKIFVMPDFRSMRFGVVEKSLKNENVFSEVFSTNHEILTAQEAAECLIIDQKPAQGTLVDLSKPLYTQFLVASQP